MISSVLQKYVSLILFGICFLMPSFASAALPPDSDNPLLRALDNPRSIPADGPQSFAQSLPQSLIPGGGDFAAGLRCRMVREVPITKNGVGSPDVAEVRVFGDCRGTPRCKRAHTGFDLTLPNGQLVPLPSGCKIDMNGNTPIHNTDPGGYGPSMIFDCSELAGGADVKVLYAHLNGYDANAGMAINGCGGNASCNSGLGPHIHLEIRIKGVKVDPACVWGEWVNTSVYTELPDNIMTGKHYKRTGANRESAYKPQCPAPLQNGTPADLCNANIRELLKQDAYNKIGDAANGGALGSGNTVNPSSLNGQGTFIIPPGSGAGHNHDLDTGGNNAPIDQDYEGDIKQDDEGCTANCCPCTDIIINNHKKIRSHVDEFPTPQTPKELDRENSEFEEHRKWLVYTFFHEHVLYAVQRAVSQLTTVGVDQVHQIGRLLDAKHQLETQRLFQTLKAQAHKDYHPSEGLCEIGTNTRSLMSSERLSDLSHLALSQQFMQRQLLSGSGIAVQGPVSDKRSRLENYIETFCNPADNGNGLSALCGESGGMRDMINADVDFTRSIETKLTLDIDFSGEEAPAREGMNRNTPPVTKHAEMQMHGPVKNKKNKAVSSSGQRALKISDMRFLPAQTGEIIAVEDRVELPSDKRKVSGNVLLNDEGAFGLTVTKVQGAGLLLVLADLQPGQKIRGQYGDLEITPDGIFTYELYEDKELLEEDVFAYTIGNARTDFDRGSLIIHPPEGSGGGDGGIDIDIGIGIGIDDGVYYDPQTGQWVSKGPGSGGNDGGREDVSEDEQRMRALTSNLVAHDVLPRVQNTILANEDGLIRPEAVEDYMDLRALVAKRSVAVNSLAALVSMRASGDPTVAPFAKKLIEELGVPEDEIDALTGIRPSYFAQMEILTKHIHMNPTFYTELYDKPANVDRKNLALRAIGVMQDRDLFESLLRSEMTTSILLEKMLDPEHREISANIDRMNRRAEEASE